MGYHLTITRERKGIESPIPLDDWLAHVRNSPELEFETPEGDDPTSRFLRSVHAAAWNGRDDAWLGWSNGEIWTKNPPEELISYMIEFAPTFDARVRGDEGEYYRSSSEDYYYEEEGREVSRAEYEQRAAKRARNPWLRIKRFLGGIWLSAIIIGILLLLRLIFT
jgi:hypothetical protein